MNVTKEFDTIAAISTPPGEGAITIIRLSGDDAVEIAEKISHYNKKKLTEVSSHTIHFGHIKDPETNEMIDEVMFTVMLAPKTFTRENIVEINCHGGMVVANQILQLILRHGGRLAEPGEFTKRAFLNGRLDLSQAEAVMDLIQSKTNDAMKLALNQLDGKLSTLIKQLREEILQALAQVEVNIDYPEYDDVETMTTELLKEKAMHVKSSIDYILSTAKQGKILREGLSTAIIGRPNVGKSSLLNYLLQEDKAIVTDIAGTTRDAIEEYVNVKGIPLKLIDTAGIRETDDVVEKIGVERSKKVLDDADLILLMLNQSEPLTKVDLDLLNSTKNKHRIILLNKSDLTPKTTLTDIQRYTGEDNVLMISVMTSEGVDKLEQAIKNLFFLNSSNSKDASYVSNARHISLLERAKEALDDALNGIKLEMPVDLIQIDMTRSWELLGEIIGDNVQDELITQLFSQFCLGK